MIYLQDPDFTLHQGDALEVLRALPDESVHMCVTSPPFYGLRDYGTGTWEGGDEDCDHAQRYTDNKLGQSSASTRGGAAKADVVKPIPYAEVCGKCGARRVDRQIGLEASPDQWVNALVDVFREVRRVLRSDGTLWLECGDSYATGTTAKRNPTSTAQHGGWEGDAAFARVDAPGCKPKDLIGAPWLLAFALRADGWYLRSDIIWARPNPMPESVRDRPTKSHSYVFLLSKSSRYFFDQEAVRESNTEGTLERFGTNQTRSPAAFGSGTIPPGHPTETYPEHHQNGLKGPVTLAGRNIRSVWTIPTEPLPDEHYAAYPSRLVERCILAGTSERGCCPECGAPWVRVTESTGGGANHHGAREAIDPQAFGRMLKERREQLGLSRRDVAVHFPSKTGGLTGIIWNWENGLAPPTPSQWPRLRDLLSIGDEYDHLFVTQEATTDGWKVNERGALVSGKSGLAGSAAKAKALQTTGWLVSCVCKGPDLSEAVDLGHALPAPCVVLDPFLGSGTTALVARKHGRRTIGIELSPTYCAMAARRLSQLSLLA